MKMECSWEKQLDAGYREGCQQELIRGYYKIQDFHGGSDGKASAYNVGDPGSIPGSGRSPGKGNGNPIQCSCLENPIDGGAWQATVQGVAKSWTRLSDFTTTTLLQNPDFQSLQVNKAIQPHLKVLNATDICGEEQGNCFLDNKTPTDDPFLVSETCSINDPLSPLNLQPFPHHWLLLFLT